MTNPKDNAPQVVDCRSTTAHANNYQEAAYRSAAATLFGHPARVILNRVASNAPRISLLEFGKLNAISLPTNLLRGTSIFFTQLSARDHFPTYPNVASISAGAIVASLFETPLIRQNQGAKFSARFCVPLTGCYVFRETAFIRAVIGSNNLPFIEHSLWFSAGVLMTSTAHKAAVYHATKDLYGSQYTTPNLTKDGLRIFRHMSEGAYTHPAFATPVKHPTSNLQRAMNVAAIVCPPKVVAARALYLGLFKAGYMVSTRENRNKIYTSMRGALRT